MATTTTTTSLTSICCHRGGHDRGCGHGRTYLSTSSFSPCMPSLYPRAILDDSKTVLSAERVLESEKMVDGMDFGELCNEFECNSSPSVEATARQLARDILELRQGNRALGSYSISVKYKDPVRSFTGRERYKRPLWATYALENPKVTVQEMEMLSTSILSIKWTIQGKAKNFDPINVLVCVNSRFTMNQMSGQVVEHEERWDVSLSPPIAQGYFWISRVFFSAIDAVKDTTDSAKKAAAPSEGRDSPNIYPNPSGDPTKFIQSDDGLQRDLYQIALFMAVVYLVVQYLRSTL